MDTTRKKVLVPPTHSNLPPGVTERMIPGNEPDERPEVEATCDHCNRGIDAHHEESVEDHRGNDYEIFKCYPPGEASAEELAHFAKHGCIDMMPVTDSSQGLRWCEACGEDLPDDHR